jgi:hypothetical protein
MDHSTLLDRIVKGRAMSPAAAMLAQARKVAILSTDLIAGD